jgi:TRAP-type C4-dicarboxylate transport system permease small subunit
MSDGAGLARPMLVRALDGLTLVVGWASGMALLTVALVIFFNATGRYLTGWSFLGGEELARLLTVWITFIGGFALVRAERHVSIDLVLRAVPPVVQRLFRGFMALIGLVTMAFLAVWAWDLCVFSFGSGKMGTTLPVPRGLFFLPVLIGAVLMGIGFLEILVRAIRNTLGPLPSLSVEDADLPEKAL